MANKIYPFTTPSNYTYDSDKIELVDGKAKLKAQSNPNIYAHYHLNEATGETVIDSSGNGRDGTPINNPASVVGKLNNCLSFNGNNQYVNCGDIANFERTDAFSLECWLKTTDTGTGCILTKSVWDGSTYRGYILTINAGKIRFYLVSDIGTGKWIYVTTNNSFNDGTDKHIVVTYNGSSLASGINIYVNNVNQSLTVNVNALGANTIVNTANFQISGRGGENELYEEQIDEVVIYDKELTQAEVTQRYNSGNGTETPLEEDYPSDKPTIKPTTSWTISGLSQFTAFVESLGGGNQGSIGYQLSDDDGVNWRYWNGSSWAVTADQYNAVSTVHTNIGSFLVANEKIMFRAFLISNGEQQCELDTLDFTALVGNPPVVYAGADKSCYDHQTIKLFDDVTISDPDGDIEQASVWYNIEESGWIQIPKGSYGTLQEAIRNFQYTFDNIVVVNCQLKIIDQSSKETIDDMNMTVQKYLVTFNAKDKDGNHLANFQFLPNDGSDWQTKNSPFIWEYDWQADVYKVIFDKVGFQTAKADIEVSVHTENITMNVLGAVSPAEVADAVWDELKAGHVLTNSFGKISQDMEIEVNKIQPEIITKKNEYKADVTNLDVAISSRAKESGGKIDSIKADTTSIISTLSSLIANIWNYSTRTLTSFGTLVSNVWSNITRTITAGTRDTEIDTLVSKAVSNEVLIKRILGLTSENYKLYDCSYTNGLLVSGKIKIYSTATDYTNDTNVLATYQIEAVYNGDGTCNRYGVKKI